MIIHKDKLRWLFWLRWKLLTRKFTGGPGRIAHRIALILQLIATLFGGTMVAITLSIFFRVLAPGTGIGLLLILLTGVYLIWIISPLAGFYTNEGLNLSKLSQFPLSRLELMASLVISTLLDFSTLWLVFLFLAVVIGWGTSILLVLFSLVTVLVFYVQIVSMSQLILALLASLLKTRRFRDLGIFLLALLSMSGYFCQLTMRGYNGQNFLDILTNASFLSYLQWIPPGMAARVIQQATIGHWLISLIWLAGLAIITFVTLYLWQRVVERSLSTPESGGTVKPLSLTGTSPMPKVTPVLTVSRPAFYRPLSTQALAILVKDVKYLRREPQMTTLLVRSLFLIILPMAYMLTNQSLGYWRVIYLPFLVLFSLLGLSHNAFGYERQSLSTLLLFPVNPKQILRGKNALVFLLGLLEMGIGIPLVAFLTQNWELVLPVFTIGIAGLGILAGYGNFMSIFFPSQVQFAQRGSQINVTPSSESGCLRITKALTAILVEFLLLLPVFIALILPLYFAKHWIWIFTIPSSLVYGVAIYLVITHLVAPHLINRIPEMVERLTRN